MFSSSHNEKEKQISHLNCSFPHPLTDVYHCNRIFKTVKNGTKVSINVVNDIPINAVIVTIRIGHLKYPTGPTS